VKGSEGWEIGALLERFLVLWWRWGVGCLALFSIELFGCFFWDVICKGVKGYVIVGWDAWVWIICGV
jgi:hypothetical protein